MPGNSRNSLLVREGIYEVNLPHKKLELPGKAVAVGDSQYVRLVRFFGARLANEQDAQDLAQEAYLRLLRASDSKMIRNPVAYLFRIARNLLHEWYSSLPPRAEPLHEVELASEGGTVEDYAEIAQYMDRLGEVLRQLPPKCRAAILMHRRDGMTYNEIGATLGVSSSMVKKYLSQGLARCRVGLRELHES